VRDHPEADEGGRHGEEGREEEEVLAAVDAFRESVANVYGAEVVDVEGEGIRDRGEEGDRDRVPVRDHHAGDVQRDRSPVGEDRANDVEEGGGVQ